MATTQRSDRPTVREMVVVHHMFRSVFGDLPRLVRGVPDGDREKAEVVVDHIELGVDALHHHHTAEDRLLWPVLIERATPESDVVERMESQHEGLAGLLERVQVQAEQFRHTASSPDGERLAATLEQFATTMAEHLDDEEAHILPMVEQHLTVQEWDHLGEEASGSLSATERVIMMGMLKDAVPPEEADLLLHHAPVLIRKVGWPLVMHRQYEHYKQRLAEASPGA